MSRSTLLTRERWDRGPLIVGTLVAGRPLASQLRAARSADVIEVRLDGFAEAHGPMPAALSFVSSLLSEVRRSRKPILATFRSPTEAGGPAREVTDRHREAVLLAALPHAALIDVEIRRPALAQRLTRAAHARGVAVIHSFHDFEGPSSKTTLDRLRRASAALGGDVFKAAVRPRTNDDVERLLLWGRGVSKPALCLIAMGDIGVMSRFVAFSFGSILTYGHLGASAAPGQVPVAALARGAAKIYGGRARVA